MLELLDIFGGIMEIEVYLRLLMEVKIGKNLLVVYWMMGKWVVLI